MKGEAHSGFGSGPLCCLVRVGIDSSSGVKGRTKPSPHLGHFLMKHSPSLHLFGVMCE